MALVVAIALIAVALIAVAFISVALIAITLIAVILVATIATLLAIALIVVTVAVLIDLRAGERMLEAVILLEVLVAQRYPRVVYINSQAALAILIKTLYVLVDVLVCTVLALRASDGARAGGFGNGVIVVRVMTHHHVRRHSVASTVSTVASAVSAMAASVPSTVSSAAS